MIDSKELHARTLFLPKDLRFAPFHQHVQHLSQEGLVYISPLFAQTCLAFPQLVDSQDSALLASVLDEGVDQISPLGRRLPVDVAGRASLTTRGWGNPLCGRPVGRLAHVVEYSANIGSLEAACNGRVVEEIGRRRRERQAEETVVRTVSRNQGGPQLELACACRQIGLECVEGREGGIAGHAELVLGRGRGRRRRLSIRGNRRRRRCSGDCTRTHCEFRR